MDKGNKNLNLIQVLRGLASLLVVFLHISINSNDVLNKDFMFNFFLFGYSGVDIFFVLSGFIITYTSIKGASQPAKLLPFVRRRLVRIFPTYWIIATLFLFAQVILPSFYKTHYDFSILNIISTYLLLPGHVMVNGVSWTLTFELFFYLLFLLVFILPNKRWVFTGFLIYSLFIIGFTITGHYTQDIQWIRLIFSPLNIEFFMGMLSALLVTKIPARYSIVLITAGSILFLFNGLLTDAHFTLFKNDFNRVVLFGIPAFLIILGVVSYEINHTIKAHNIFLYLGEASYSLYLIHLPFVAAFIKLFPRLHIHSDLIYHVLCLLLVVIICFISIKFYQLIEKPIITRLNARSPKKKYVYPIPEAQ